MQSRRDRIIASLLIAPRIKITKTTWAMAAAPMQKPRADACS